MICVDNWRKTCCDKKIILHQIRRPGFLCGGTNCLRTVSISISVVNNTLTFSGSLGTFGINASSQKIKVQNLGTGQLDASINVDGNIVDGVNDFTWAPISGQNRCRTHIANHICLAASAMSDLRRVWCQLRVILTSKLRVYQCCVSVHGKVNMSTRIWYLDHSIGSRQYIRFCDLDHSAGWHRATGGNPREMSANNHRPVWRDFVSNEEVRTRTRLVPLNETIAKQRVSLSFR